MPFNMGPAGALLLGHGAKKDISMLLSSLSFSALTGEDTGFSL